MVRVFSSADDVRRGHPILDRTIDIVAGAADPITHIDALQAPTAVATDSNHRVFVADPGAKGIHIFDFSLAKYRLLDAEGDRLRIPVSLAVDGQDNLYVVDQSSKLVLVYDSAGKFRRYLGKLRGGESYFDNPLGIAIDRTTGHIYVTDAQRQMLFIMDQSGRLIRKVGKRGGGDAPGEFRFPSAVVFAAGEVFVLDSGNARVQILDYAGRFLRAVSLPYSDLHTGLAVDGRGNLYVSDPSLNRIQIFAPDGRELERFDPATVKGANFGRASAEWIEAGRWLYLLDSQNNRIAVFQID